MNYMQRLWRAELIGLGSLALVSLPIAIVLALFFDLGPSSPTGLQKFFLVFVSIYIDGITAVVTYAAPVFALYLFNPSFRLLYLLGFAALPGFAVFLIFGSELGLGLIPYGLAVALTMCGMARLWPGKLDGEST